MANEPQPSPEFIAQQLRKPSGEAAAKVGDNMNTLNEPVFDLTLETMDIKDKERILEIGFGTGSFLHKLFSRSAGIMVDGIDYSQEMVDMAKRTNNKLVDAGSLNLQMGASDNLPYESDTFDKIFCNMVVYFWDEPEIHLKEVHRVLKPGGTFYTGIRTAESMRPFPFIDFGFNLFSINDWKEILNNNGFKVLETCKSKDPPIEQEEGILTLESVCVVAEKK